MTIFQGTKFDFFPPATQTMKWNFCTTSFPEKITPTWD